MNAIPCLRQSHPLALPGIFALSMLSVLLAWTAQPAMAEPAASAARGDAAPKDGAQGAAAADVHARGHHPDARGDDARGAPAEANELQVAPTRRLSRKPYVFPQPHHAVGGPIRPQHWPTGISSGPARNAIGIAIDHGSAVRAPPALRPLWAVAGPTGLPKNPTANIGATATANGLVHQGTAAPILTHPTGITGTGMVRAGAGAATIGGPTRATTGINGTSFRPKHGG
jgi:hypothetical protein